MQSGLSVLLPGGRCSGQKHMRRACCRYAGCPSARSPMQWSAQNWQVAGHCSAGPSIQTLWPWPTPIIVMLNKKLTELFLRKQDREKLEEAARSQQQSIPFDENYFELKIDKNTTQLPLIRIEAIVLKGEKTGEKVNLRCKWYNRTKEDFVEIPDVTGCFYQPNLDDVNTTISVQAEPFMQGKEYQGITIMRDIGPLKLDDKVEQMCRQATKDDKLEMPARLENIYSQDEKFSRIEPPQEVLTILTSNELKLYAKNSKNKYDLLTSYQITRQLPTIEILRKTFNSALLNGSQTESFRMSFEDNLHRDVFALTLRTFCGRRYVSTPQGKPSEPAQSKCAASAAGTAAANQSLDFILKLDELSRSLSRTKRQLQTLQQSYDSERRSHAKLIDENSALRKDLKELEDRAKELEQFKAHSEKLQEENSFYVNEIGIYKKAIRDKDKELDLWKARVAEMQEDKRLRQEDEHRRVREPLEKAQQLQAELDEIKAKVEKMEASRQELQAELEKALDEKNWLAKKCEGLAESTNKKQQQSTNHKMKLQLDQRQAQVAALKSHMFKLQHLYNKLQAERKQAQKWDLKQIVNSLKGSKNQQAVVVSLQKLVNNLTEIVNEKEIELDSQKFINKELMRKLALN